VGKGFASAAVVGVTLLGAACAAPRKHDTVRALVVVTGTTAGVYHPLGEALARIYSARIPGIQVSAQTSTGSAFNVEAVQKGRADVAFTQGDVAYSAFRQGSSGDPRPHSDLRAIAVLYTNVAQIVVRRDSPVRNVRELRGRRVGVGPPGSNSEQTSRTVMDALGFKPGDLHAESLGFDEAANRIVAGQLDASFMMLSYPVPAIRAANEAAGIRLLTVDRTVVDRIRERYPFFRPTVIPRESYAGQDGDVTTLGVDNLLVCHADLDEELVHELTRLLIESVPDLVKAHVAARGIDPEQAPTAPIPLHAGAARFYRERELSR